MSSKYLCIYLKYYDTRMIPYNIGDLPDRQS